MVLIFGFLSIPRFRCCQSSKEKLVVNLLHNLLDQLEASATFHVKCSRWPFLVVEICVIRRLNTNTQTSDRSTLSSPPETMTRGISRRWNVAATERMLCWFVWYFNLCFQEQSNWGWEWKRNAKGTTLDYLDREHLPFVPCHHPMALYHNHYRAGMICCGKKWLNVHQQSKNRTAFIDPFRERRARIGQLWSLLGYRIRRRGWPSFAINH